MKKKWVLAVAVSCAIFILSSLLVRSIMIPVETPAYDIIRSQDNVEIRHYKPMIVAEVHVEGEREDALSHGFRLLADYIFGQNTLKQTIAMTAPVQQQAHLTTDIQKTAQQQSTNNLWNIRFIMPSHYTLETLPQPNNKRVLIKKIPAHSVAVIIFSGTPIHDYLQKYEKLLIAYIHAHNLAMRGAPQYAFYHPPWTPPPLRRNEVMIEIAYE